MAKHFYKVIYYTAHNFKSISSLDQVELARLLEFMPGKSIELQLNSLHALRLPLCYFCMSPIELKSDSIIIKALERTLVGVHTILNQDRSLVNIEVCKSKKCNNILPFIKFKGHYAFQSLIFMRKVRNIKPSLHRITDVSDLIDPYAIAENI